MKRHHLVALAWLALASPGMAAQGSGCLPTTGVVSGLTMTQRTNDAFAALTSSFSGASAPATDCSGAAVKGQFWVNTAQTPNLLQQYDGTSWIVLGAIDSANHLWSLPVGGGVASVTAATVTDLCAAPAAVQNIAGTTTITGFGSGCVIGLRKTLLFNSATPLTYNAISLILPGQASYTANPGDVADAVYLGAGNWRIIAITKIDGSAVTNPATPVGTTLYGEWGTIPAKTVYKAGQALSRASYPEYFNAMTRVQSGTLTAGNNTITGLSNTSGFGPGMPIEGTGVQAGSTIASVTPSTIVMSLTATANGSQSVRVFITGYGSGGDSTTVGVTDCRGRGMAGRDDMLVGPANRLTAAYFGQGSRIGGAGGFESHTLTQAQMPQHQHTGTTGGMNQNNPHSHSSNANSSAGGMSGGGGNQQGTPPAGATIFATDINHTHSFTTDVAGSSLAHPIVQPTQIAECVVVVLP